MLCMLIHTYQQCPPYRGYPGPLVTRCRAQRLTRWCVVPSPIQKPCPQGMLNDPYINPGFDAPRRGNIPFEAEPRPLSRIAEQGSLCPGHEEPQLLVVHDSVSKIMRSRQGTVSQPPRASLKRFVLTGHFTGSSSSNNFVRNFVRGIDKANHFVTDLLQRRPFSCGIWNASRGQVNANSSCLKLLSLVIKLAALLAPFRPGRGGRYCSRGEKKRR